MNQPTLKIGDLVWIKEEEWEDIDCIVVGIESIDDKIYYTIEYTMDGLKRNSGFLESDLSKR